MLIKEYWMMLQRRALGRMVLRSMRYRTGTATQLRPVNPQ